MTWKSFQRQAPRTVVGRVLKPNGAVRHWFHFACRLSVEDLGSMFALLIEPTWLFTRDGNSIMRSYRVSGTATRKMSLEDNARILYNLHCWMQVLSDNPRTIKLPLGGHAAIVSKTTITVKTKVGISGDRVNVPEIEVDPDTDIPVPLPLEEDEPEDNLEE